MRRRLSLLVLALACALPAAGQPPDLLSLILWQRGYVAHLRGEYAQAVQLFRDSIALRPSAEAHAYLGWSLSHLGRLEEAIAECRTAIRLDPEFGNPYNDIGVYLIALGRMDEAVPWLEKALRAKRYCCYQFAHFNLGRVLLEQGRLAEAQRSFERALEIDPAYELARKALEFIRQRGLRQL
jgi:tetratricopeptide (TPR) repeat protein